MKALAAFVLLCSVAAAQPCVWPQAKVVGSDTAAYDRFGAKVAASYPVVVVGAPDHGHHGPFAGAAYAFRWSGSQWVQEQELAGQGISNFHRFGSAVAVDGDVLAVGAAGDPQMGSSAGSVFLFRHVGTSWVQETKLLPPPPVSSAAFNEFGAAVSISGDAIAVGVELDDQRGTSAGAVHIFRRVGTVWQYETKLMAVDGVAGDKLGSSVEIRGEVLVAGAPGRDDLGSSCGAAYVFTRAAAGTWTQQKLLASDGGVSDFTGQSVGTSGSVIVIGSAGDDDKGINAGAAYVWTLAGSTWTQTQKLLASDGAAGDAFGAVSIHGDVIGVGATGDDDKGLNAGAVYVFRKATTWTQEAKLLGADSKSSDAFGGAMAAGQGVIVSGAWSHDGAPGNNSGAAYVFSAVCAGCVNAVQCDDGNGCTDDSCVGGVCVHSPKNCNDSDACTVDGCTAGNCTHLAISCDDGVACTEDSCVNGQCEHCLGSCSACDVGPECCSGLCVAGRCQ